MSYTPGPWEARKSGRVEFLDPPAIIDVPDHVVRVYIDEQGRRCTQFIATCTGTQMDNAANAKLIAAATELAEALKEALAVCATLIRAIAVADCDIPIPHEYDGFGVRAKTALKKAGIE